ncbi:hypothetical protein BGZ99_006230 [Dissophora globulifera]|uniref:Uncharacterized protein n=1 Tax=Dissophora globulifera TaxID=979702 RepID=A0A9P6RHM3_9FUNG|nr:hypothetical protein BGZ99_006230 [Dissophora globulifera]
MILDIIGSRARVYTSSKWDANTSLKIHKKLPRTSNWVRYDSKDGPVNLPPVLVSMLDSGKFAPAPRNKVKQQLDNMEVGQKITLPSIGQQHHSSKLLCINQGGDSGQDGGAVDFLDVQGLGDFIEG